MKNTTNYKLKKPEGTDVVNVEDFNANADIIDGKLKELETNEIFYAVATGSANTYAVSISAISTLSTYFDGLAVCVKINAVSTGASTLNVNGWGAKSIVDSLGNPITNGGLKANTPYTLRYNGSVFILQGKGGGGNVTADKLLIGYKATGDTGEVVGTMPDNGAINITPGATAKTIPQGYTSGGTVAGDSDLITGNIKAGVNIFGVTGKSSVVDTADGSANPDQMLTGSNAYVNGSKVVGTMPNNGALTITPGATAKTIPLGFHNGSGTVTGDSNLISANIKAGKTIFGVTGSTNVVDTADANLDPAYLLSGYSGYDDGVKKAGTLTNLGSSQTAHDTWTDGNGTLVFRVPSIGAFTSNVNGYKPEVNKYDGNFIASNIVSGKNIFGVGGTANPYSMGGLYYASGTATPTIGSVSSTSNCGNLANIPFPFSNIVWFACKGTFNGKSSTGITFSSTGFCYYHVNVYSGACIIPGSGANQYSQQKWFKASIPFYYFGSSGGSVSSGSVTWWACGY